LRGKSHRTLELIESCLSLLEVIQPASVRAVCYQLFTRQQIASMSKNETQRVSRLLTDAREEGRIPWVWIVDETRVVERVSTWADPGGFARTITRAYRKDKWATQPRRVEVWSEKGTVRGTLAPILDQYEIPFRVNHGFASATSMNDAAETVRSDRRPLVILYVGDWDPSGLHMSIVDIPRRLTQYTGSTRGLSLRRIALRVDNTQQLPSSSFEAATKDRDPRDQWFIRHFGRRCWELDAMNPVTLRQRVERTVRRLLHRPTWDRYVRAEAVEQRSITEAVSTWKNLKEGDS